MKKKLQRTSTEGAKGQTGQIQNPLGKDNLKTSTLSWLAIAAAFGSLMVLSFLAPVDSISVFVGTALPQNLGWLLLAVLTAFATRRSSLQLHPSRTELAVVSCALCWLIAVTWLDSQHGNGRAVWNGFWQVMSLACCFYIGRALMQCSQVRAIVILILIVGCTAMSFVGLEQVLVSMPASRAKYAENPEKVLAENGLDAPPGSPRRAQFENRLNSPEPFANFALANSLAALLCLGVMLNAGAIANAVLRDDRTQKHDSHNHKLQKWMGLTGLSAALLIQLICLLLTRSRTAYLSVLAATSLWLILEWTRGKVRLADRTLRIAGLMIGALAIAGLGWLLTVDSLVWSEAPKSIGYRLEYWQATLAMIRDHAWTGVGLGNFQAYYPQYKLDQASEIIADPHNWILDVAATLSVPIAMLAVSWIGFTIVRGIGACLGDQVSEPAYEADVDSQFGRPLVRSLAIGTAVGGGLAAALLGLSDNLDFPTNLTASVLSTALGWMAWQSRGVKPSAANMIAAVVAVVLCLLSSGSWQASGIAIPLMCLLAIGQSSAPGWKPKPWGSEPDLAPGWKPRLLAPMLALAGVAAFALQTWRPVMQSWMLVENSATARSAEEQIRLFEMAAAADPLDTERAMHKVQLLAAKANEASAATAFTAEAEQVMQELERIAPPNVVSFLRPKLAGDISSQFATSAKRRGLPNEEYLTAARRFYSLAVRQYPSSVELQVQHAAASAMLNDWSTAQESLEKALQMSDQTPHLDKKLAAQMIYLPLKPVGFESQSDNVPAEPFADWLRTEIKTQLR